MDIKRRDFFRNVGRKNATVAASATAPALVNLNSLSDELKALSKELNRKIGSLSAEVKEQIQLYSIFLLLVSSFAIDAGVTAIWVIS